MGKGNRGYKEGKLVIHEATPLGKQYKINWHGTFGEEMIRYPAILLGKEVWMDKPARPEPKFKVR
ncbi:unnamed protein product, partial [marine sediment metagenome]